jgi:hypothetical protein
MRDHYDVAIEEPRGPSRLPPTTPTTRVVASPEKVRPRHTTAATTVGIQWPGPLPSKRDPRVARAQSSKNQTLKGYDY